MNRHKITKKLKIIYTFLEEMFIINYIDNINNQIKYNNNYERKISIQLLISNRQKHR